MSTQDNNSLLALIALKSLKIGNEVLGTDNLPTTASQPLYVDSSKKLAAGDIPFTMVLAAGSTDTSYSAMQIKGSATDSADELMHLTLVKAANTTAVVAGYARVTVTDAAGVITSGAYYAPFYTLT